MFLHQPDRVATSSVSPVFAVRIQNSVPHVWWPEDLPRKATLSMPEVSNLLVVLCQPKPTIFLYTTTTETH
jgi:hypothetical protein